MPQLTSVVRGTQATAESFFYKIDGVTPFPGIGGASYAIFTPTNFLIAKGMGAQDPNNSAHWTIQFTIPTTAPITSDNAKYRISWVLSGANGSSNVQTEYFSVVDQLVESPDDTAVITLQGVPFETYIVLPYANPITLSLRILDDNANILAAIPTSTILPQTPTQLTNGNYQFKVVVDASQSITSTNNGIGTYVAYFNYTDPNNEQHTNIQYVYVLNTLVARMINSVRMKIDALRNRDIIPQLIYTDLRILHFIFEGLDYCNSVPPSNGFSLSLNSQFRQEFYQFIVTAACIKLLQSQYLAEGMGAFEFSGQSTTLSVDRTQFINQMISDYQQEMTPLSLAKNHAIRSGFKGAVGGVRGPVSNFVYKVPYTSAGFLFPIPFY